MQLRKGASPDGAKGLGLMYRVYYSFERFGWCVYQEHTNGLSVRFVSGPYQDEDAAKKEAERRNAEA